MKDAVATMGDVLPDDVEGRDAVHVAVISAKATEKLSPGQDVGYHEGDAGTKFPAIGIVDPFIKRAIMPSERFWLFLYPRSITGLRHEWTHPSFDEGAPKTTYATPNSKAASEAWLRDFINTADCPDYEELMAGVARAADGSPCEWGDDNYLHFSGSDAHGEIPAEFWVHAEIVLGRPIKCRPQYFSCAC